MTVTFSGSPLSKGKLLAGSGDRKTDFICRDWDLEGANSCKFTINSSANINTGEEKGVYYTSQKNAFRLEMRGGLLNYHGSKVLESVWTVNYSGPKPMVKNNLCVVKNNPMILWKQSFWFQEDAWQTGVWGYMLQLPTVAFSFLLFVSLCSCFQLR